MARFRATLQGCRGPTSRLGTPRSGITAEVNGWHIGVRVRIEVDSSGNDVIRIFETGGSSRALSTRHIATITQGENT